MQEFIRFCQSLYKTEKPIPLHAPMFIGNEKKYLLECIDSTFVSSVGEFVDRFEKKMAEYTGALKSVVCVNGTQALHLALILAGVKTGDEVITQPLTFVATANAISYTGAKPVFIDVDLETMGLSPLHLGSFLAEHTEIRNDGNCYNKNTGKRIAACIPMHTFGHPCKIEELAELCMNYNIILIEDAAESIGSIYKNRHTGTFGLIGIQSFNGNKTITTGGGGMILTNDENLGKLAKHLSTQAKVSHPYEFIHDQVGYNYRMPNINAAIGLAQLENLEVFIAKKRDLAMEYKSFFDRKGIGFFMEPENCRSNYWLNTIFLQDQSEKESFLQYTNGHNVMTRPAWKLMNTLPMFTDCQAYDLKNSEWIAERAVNIPSSVRLD